MFGVGKKIFKTKVILFLAYYIEFYFIKNLICIICIYILLVVIFSFQYSHFIPPRNTRKLKNKNTRTRCEICSKLTIKTNFTPCSRVSIVNFEQLNFGWVLFFVRCKGILKFLY